MKASTKKKSVTKTIFAICFALSIFIGNSSSAFVAICDRAPDGVHHFEAHMQENEGILRHLGPHKYVYGYDAQRNPIYKYDCQVTTFSRYCNYVCKHCGTKQDGTRHEHLISTNHSIDHN